jgi:hypothetical protein
MSTQHSRSEITAENFRSSVACQDIVTAAAAKVLNSQEASLCLATPEQIRVGPRQVELGHLLQCLAAIGLRIRRPDKNHSGTHNGYQNNSSHESSEMRGAIYLVEIFFKAAAIPAPTESGLPTAQKCIKNNRGCSVNMWLCSAFTEILWA